ncbi:hypothetical protein GPALN_010568 [Globodera pallida]|nr:hypothetical protein GPALN_010568 [Globodera pallida]
MSEKQRISIVLIFLTLIILNSPCAKGGKDGLSSKATKIGLHQKFNNLEAELTDVRQLIHANFALTLDHEKMRAEIENLKERVLNLEMMNCALRTMSGEYEHHQALLNERRLTKSKSVPIEHSQQLIYNGNSKYNSEELGTMSDEVFMSETINGWDPNKCNGNLSIDSDHLVVLHKETSVSCCSVFAKSTIENHNFGFFYYEVTIVKECGPLFIGLANKRTMSVDGWVGYAPGSYAYSSGGHLFGHTVKDKIRPIDTTIPFVANDIIGCGSTCVVRSPGSWHQICGNQGCKGDESDEKQALNSGREAGLLGGLHYYYLDKS